jgi:hypothetical protein
MTSKLMITVDDLLAELNDCIYDMREEEEREASRAASPAFSILSNLDSPLPVESPSLSRSAQSTSFYRSSFLPRPPMSADSSKLSYDAPPPYSKRGYLDIVTYNMFRSKSLSKKFLVVSPSQMYVFEHENDMFEADHYESKIPITSESKVWVRALKS